MKKIYILAIFLLAFALAGCASQSSPTKNSSSTNKNNTALETNVKTNSGLLFKETSFDFGLIKQSAGPVSHNFAFTYTGKNPIKIVGLPTSCGCTSATMTPTNLKPGDSGILTVHFNPNLHAEPKGKFFKTVSIVTEPKLENTPEIKIWAEINLDLGPQAYELNNEHVEDGKTESVEKYKQVSAEEFNKMLQHKDFTLIDVHIPTQEHIKGTDLVIPYNEIAKYKNKLPKNKDAKIVVYCRSGGMSRAAASVLEDQGYTNIYDLIGGKNAYDNFLKNQ